MNNVCMNVHVYDVYMCLHCVWTKHIAGTSVHEYVHACIVNMLSVVQKTNENGLD